ncbi:MAG: hypothetical protein ABW252_21995 [Polyangiales bacterium]
MRDDDTDDDPALSRALAELPRVDMPKLAARALRVRAERRLDGRRPGWLARQEPRVLVALSAAQLVWAVLRVLDLAAP